MTHSGRPSRDVVARYWKVAEIGAIVVCALCGIAAGALWMYYDYTRPPIPDVGAGRIYRLNTHGSIVYPSRTENILLWTASAIAVSCGLGAIWIDFYKRPLRKHTLR